eukprot:c30830_g1_i1 orf=196-375(+)
MHGKEKFVCKLKKSLYGLKEASREWYHKFDAFTKSQGYKRSEVIIAYTRTRPRMEVFLF